VYWAVFGLIAVAMVSCLAGFLMTARLYTADGGSMQNTIRVGDDMWLQKGDTVRRGDIVAYTIPAGGYGRIPSGTYIKRVIGLPGDRVACCDARGDVTVNGQALHEQAYLHPGDKPSAFAFSATLKPGQVWVMGDDRKISYDSRGYGPVPEQYVTGRVLQVDRGLSGKLMTTPATFVADGLAPPDDRAPTALLLLFAVMVLFVVLVLDGGLGIVLWSARRRRAHRQALAAGQVI
jgi:signal peptidase I